MTREPSPSLAFAGLPLDRAEAQRRDPRWIEAQLEAEAARFLPLHRLEVLVTTAATPGLAWARGIVREAMDPSVGAVLLGLRDGIAHFAVDVSGLETPLAWLDAEGAARFEDVRGVAARLPAPEAAIAGHARARIAWHARHVFCSVCGERTQSRAGGAQRRCGSCEAEHFPRTDPVAIAVVARGGRCLLGRQRGWPAALHSALAGYVESGESLEEAVRREVHEESGVEVGRVRYLASQPWPFPSSLMLGCLAEALGDEIRLDPVELESAAWFERERVRAVLAGAADPELVLPPPLAIAHHLLRAWVDGESA